MPLGNEGAVSLFAEDPNNYSETEARCLKSDMPLGNEGTMSLFVEDPNKVPQA